MLMQEIRKIALNSGVKPRKLNKTHLVKAIQQSEENYPCFATAANGVCDQTACIWRDDCFKLAKKTAA